MLLNLPYKVLIEKNVEDKIEPLLLELGLGRKVVMVCDTTVKELVADKIKGRLGKFDVNVIIVNSLKYE